MNIIRLRNTFLLLLLSTGMVSCEKYLDVKKQSTQVYITTAEDCQKILDNYTEMNTEYPSDTETSADNYYMDEGGFASQTPEDQDLFTWKAYAIRNDAAPQYRGPYQVVYRANLVLEKLEELKGGSTAQSVLDQIKGAALFFRAYNFWQLAQMYAKPFDPATAAQDPGIPLRTSPDINDNFGRGTVQQTYDKIVGDLQEAANLLPAASVVASRPDKAAAYAMLSRVFLSMEKYPEALSNATASLQLQNKLMDFNTITDVDSDVPFARFNEEVIFQSVTTVNAMNLYPYFAKIDDQLAASYAVNDLRRDLFLNDNGDGTFRFTGNYEPSNFTMMFSGLATDEIYLNRAECYARAGNTVAALTDLNTLLRSRWKTGTYTDFSTANADVALSKILDERRKELLMRCLRWTDLRRLNRDSRFKKDLVRKMVVNGTETVIGTLPANDLRYTLLIPNEVITNARIQQNAR